MRHIIRFCVQFVVCLVLIMGALIVYDLYKNGMAYTSTPAFDQDLGYDLRIALVGSIVIFLVDLCYQLTRSTLRLPDRRNDTDNW